MRARAHPVKVQALLFADAEEEAKPDGSGYARGMTGKVGPEADAMLEARALAEVQLVAWDDVPGEVKDAFLALYGSAAPPQKEIVGWAQKRAVMLALARPR